MIHDLHYLLKDLTDYNGETCITESGIQSSSILAQGLLKRRPIEEKVENHSQFHDEEKQ